MIDPELRIGVVGATGAVGQRDAPVPGRARIHEHPHVRVVALGRRMARRLRGRGGDRPRARRRRPRRLLLLGRHAGRAASSSPSQPARVRVCVDKSSAFRLEDGVPLVVPEVNGERALEHTGIVANPNCCTIPLTMVLAPLHDAAGLRSVRVATYQSVSGAGSDAIADLRARGRRRPPAAHGLGVRRRRVRRGGQAARGDTQDPRAPRAAGERDVRASPGRRRATPRRCGSRRRHRSRRRMRSGSSEAAPGLRLEKVPAHTPRDRHRRRARRPRACRRVRRERPRAVPRLRQPAQGRGAQRDSDRGAPRRRALPSSPAPAR